MLGVSEMKLYSQKDVDKKALRAPYWGKTTRNVN